MANANKTEALKTKVIGGRKYPAKLIKSPSMIKKMEETKAMSARIKGFRKPQIA